jgi:branched-chain amino acid transport system permease protein
MTGSEDRPDGAAPGHDPAAGTDTDRRDADDGAGERPRGSPGPAADHPAAGDGGTDTAARGSSGDGDGGGRGDVDDPGGGDGYGRIARVASLIEANWRPLAAVVAAVLLAVPFVVQSSLLFNLTLVLVYGLLAFSAIVPIGYAGQLILCQGAFFGVGAYAFVKLTTAGVPAPLSVGGAVVVTAAVAYALGRPAMGTGGIYLGILTLAFNELFIISLDLLSEFTGGSTGLSAPRLFPESVRAVLEAEVLLYYLLLVTFVVVFLAVRRLLAAETGWAFLTVKEDRLVAESLGIDSTAYRLRAFTFAGAVCGLAGGLYAPVNGYVSPTTFGLETTIDIILTGVVGGLALPIGAVFGPVVVVLVPEFLRPIAEFRLVVYGVLLIVLLIYLPEGIGGWLVERLPGEDTRERGGAVTEE